MTQQQKQIQQVREKLINPEAPINNNDKAKISIQCETQISLLKIQTELLKKDIDSYSIADCKQAINHLSSKYSTYKESSI